MLWLAHAQYNIIHQESTRECYGKLVVDTLDDYVHFSLV